MPHLTCSHYDEPSNKFVLNSTRDFVRQYAQLYSCRLMELKPVLKQKISEIWPGIPVKALHEVVADEHCVVIGTVYKNMRLKPNVLDELGEENEAGKESSSKLLAKYVDIQHDSVILEDELQRITLESADGSSCLHKLVTGIVLAVIGCESSERRGYFVVESVLLPGSKSACLDVLSQSRATKDVEDPLASDRDDASDAKLNLLELSTRGGSEDDEYLVIVSGLNLRGGMTQNDAAGAGHCDVQALFAFQRLVDMLTDEASPLRAIAKRIERFIFAGNLVRTLDSAKDEFASQSRYLLLNRRGNDRFGTGVEALKLVDNLLVQLATQMHIDVLPGANDPCNMLLPQRPLHPLLLSASSSYKTVHRVTNPYEVVMQLGAPSSPESKRKTERRSAQVRVIGSSGQNIDDMERYSLADDRLSMLHLSLLAGHLMPTAPDTLACYPFTDRDPFVLPPAETPNVYFAANQPAFASRLIESSGSDRTLLVLVPSFAATKSCVIINLRTLRSFEYAVSFD